MVEVSNNLFVGTKYDFYDEEFNNDFAFCLCAKTMHQLIAKKDGEVSEGYRGNMNKDETEYLIAERPDRRILAVNLVDAPFVEYISDKIIWKCLDFIDDKIKCGYKVLVACDQGQSRSVGIAFLHLLETGKFDSCHNYDEAITEMQKLYEDIKFGNGMKQYVMNVSDKYFEVK